MTISLHKILVKFNFPFLSMKWIYSKISLGQEKQVSTIMNSWHKEDQKPSNIIPDETIDELSL